MHQTMPDAELIAVTSEPTHIIGTRPEVLGRILDPGVNLCLWQRPVQPAVTQELASLQATQLPDVRSRTSTQSFDADVKALLQQQRLDPAAFSNWRADLRRLADLYFGVCEGRDVVLRLVTTEDDDCRRFHVDRSQLRLLCTYRGPGTEWLTDAQVDRQAQSSGAPNEDILRFGAPSHFAPFWAGILKGDAFPGNAGHGLVHRSPQIAGSGQTRVLFCLDC
ncbi:MAG: DUF1826 domain-containing protein [Chromatiales bacterium]|jgi:hypothetical protein